MALTGKKHEAIHGKTGDDLAAIKASFDNGEHTELANYGPEAAIIYQMQKMQDELDYLRTEISSNKDKATFPGLGTSNSTALAGDTTVISSGQASAITANTAKVSFVGGSATTLSFGELITTTHGKGNPNTYSIVMTAVKSGVTKTVTLTLA
tara:strand:+ start:33 stop:488 length:456 start_codon:yes stop_codon:yes gene_type:complete